MNAYALQLERFSEDLYSMVYAKQRITYTKDEIQEYFISEIERQTEGRYGQSFIEVVYHKDGINLAVSMTVIREYMSDQWDNLPDSVTTYVDNVECTDESGNDVLHNLNEGWIEFKS